MKIAHLLLTSGLQYHLTLKVVRKFVADHILNLLLFFREKILGISCESSARQMIHMKCQILLSLKNTKKKKNKQKKTRKKTQHKMMSSAAVVISTLKVKNTCSQCCNSFRLNQYDVNLIKFSCILATQLFLLLCIYLSF